ncbi:MAG: hypothetical protein ACKO91_09720 [Acidimicrobiales bacterium]
MSSLWTPDGERHVAAAEPHDPIDALGEGPDDELDDDELSEDEVRARIAAARARLRDVPAAQVVANHAMGLWELAAIHLSTDPPAMAEASLAIDAVGAIVDALGDRLGENATVLRDALAQIRLAYVHVSSSGATLAGPY